MTLAFARMVRNITLIRRGAGAKLSFSKSDGGQTPADQPDPENDASRLQFGSQGGLLHSTWDLRISLSSCPPWSASGHGYNQAFHRRPFIFAFWYEATMTSSEGPMRRTSAPTRLRRQFTPVRGQEVRRKGRVRGGGSSQGHVWPRTGPCVDT